jgi:hypothetical protein
LNGDLGYQPAFLPGRRQINNHIIRLNIQVAGDDFDQVIFDLIKKSRRDIAPVVGQDHLKSVSGNAAAFFLGSE